MNLVLDDVKETLRGKLASSQYTFVFATKMGHDTVCLLKHCRLDDDGNETTRPLGLIVARGTLLVLISPVHGSEQIENPFTQAEE